MNKNRVTNLFGVKYPIIQAGMVWCSGWKLASAVSRAGGLGLIGAGSMHLQTLKEHIQKCHKAIDLPFGVNVPLFHPEVDEIMALLIQEGIKIVFTSAGSPLAWTRRLKDHGVIVVHVVSSVKFAQKSQDAGVDAIVAEGFEAGGHNGREETTTLCLVPMVQEVIDLPLIAAGGIGSGRAMLAAEMLGAEGVQIGTRFAMSRESSAHNKFKEKVREAGEGSTVLTMKTLTPVRLIKNRFYEQIYEAERKGASTEQLKALLGRGRSKKGIFEGDLENGELEIGQVSASIKSIDSAAEIISEIWEEYKQMKTRIQNNP